ncbi:ELWxxDGT repeat protein [Spirosoma validum]|uniref:T9SS type A sorting domain-containing protein n=1 Tax=Spirosoma validum TaxID=2771355 RepID=A0A927B623_9BACT|nr:ELWxxDGT repeat protein [Spirosoma validum]MBD2756044.1 T9SS type A sorting domain-containing protein [Spirosoma validum]
MKILYRKLGNLLVWPFVLGSLVVNAQTRVKDIRSGAASSTPEQLININGVLYFVANDGVHGKELWKSDGTEQGTTLVKDIGPDAVDGEVKYLTNVNGTAFFSARVATGFGVVGELWKSDGTAAGTVELLDGQTNKAESKDPANLTSVGGTLYYSNTLALGGFGYTGLFTSNGTSSPGTRRIKYYSSEAPAYPKISQLTDVNGTLYFIYAGGLYKSNGTEATTTLVKTITSSTENTKIRNLINVNGTLFFAADESSTNTYRLWKSDGTAAGTVKVNDGIGNPAEAADAANLTNVNGTLYYTNSVVRAGTGIYWGLFKSNGPDYPNASFFGSFRKSSNDNPLSNDIPYDATSAQAARPSDLTNVNGTLYFVFAGNLWKSDGTRAGTVKITDAVAPSYLTNVNGTLYFVSAQKSIYKTDPTSSTASSVVMSSDFTYNLTNVNGTLFYTHNDPATGVELYKVDTAPVGPQSLVLTAPIYNCTTGQFIFQTSGGDNTLIEYMAPGITSWTANPNQFVDTELRTAADAKPIVLYARQNGVIVTTLFDIRALCPVGQPPMNGGLQLITPLYNCQSGAFTFQTSGGNNTLIEYMAPGITSWTTNPNQFVDTELRTAADAKPITLYARQNGLTVTALFDIRALCPVNSPARVAAPSRLDVTLRARIYPNPVSEKFTVDIEGDTDQPVRLWLVDVMGRTVIDRQIKLDQPHHSEDVGIGQQESGLYLLRISTPSQIRTLNVLKR